MDRTEKTLTRNILDRVEAVKAERSTIPEGPWPKIPVETFPP
jgi:hypothetical protein